jgi:hypothetical protein
MGSGTPKMGSGSHHEVSENALIWPLQTAADNKVSRIINVHFRFIFSTSLPLTPIHYFLAAGVHTAQAEAANDSSCPTGGPR